MDAKTQAGYIREKDKANMSDKFERVRVNEGN